MIVALYDALPAGFLDDRAAMSPALTKDGLFKSAPQAWSQARLSLAHLEAQLAGKAFLFGEQFTLRLTGSNLGDASKDERFRKFNTIAEQIGLDYDEYELETETGGPVYQLVARYAFQ